MQLLYLSCQEARHSSLTNTQYKCSQCTIIVSLQLHFEMNGTLVWGGGGRRWAGGVKWTSVSVTPKETDSAYGYLCAFMLCCFSSLSSSTQTSCRCYVHRTILPTTMNTCSSCLLSSPCWWPPGQSSAGSSSWPALHPCWDSQWIHSVCPPLDTHTHICT